MIHLFAWSDDILTSALLKLAKDVQLCELVHKLTHLGLSTHAWTQGPGQEGDILLISGRLGPL